MKVVWSKLLGEDCWEVVATFLSGITADGIACAGLFDAGTKGAGKLAVLIEVPLAWMRTILTVALAIPRNCRSRLESKGYLASGGARTELNGDTNTDADWVGCDWKMRAKATVRTANASKENSFSMPLAKRFMIKPPVEY